MLYSFFWIVNNSLIYIDMCTVYSEYVGFFIYVATEKIQFFVKTITWIVANYVAYKQIKLIKQKLAK